MMKKTLLILLLLAGTVSCAFAQNGVISELTGTVELKAAKAASFVPAKVGAVIAADTIVSTGFRSAAVIKVGSSTIAVRPLTRLSLAEIQSESDSETVKVDLQAGRVRVDVKPPAGTKANTSVQTPSATASVRGTAFEIDTVSVQVYEGTVGYQSAGGRPVAVSASQESWVDPASGGAINPLLAAQASLALPPFPGPALRGKSARMRQDTVLLGNKDGIINIFIP